MAKILVVDDEQAILELLIFNIQQAGYEAMAATDGFAAIDKALEEKPDLIVLDIMLPGIDGFEVCRRIRAVPNLQEIPIIFLSAKAEEFDKVIGLELGADDYVTKPFSPRELVARIKANLRRLAAEKAMLEQEEIHIGPFIIKPLNYEVLKDGVVLDLNPKEFELFKVLVNNKGKVLKRSYLLNKIWGYDGYADPRTVDVHICRLRQKIETDPGNPEYIETVRGLGYRFNNRIIKQVSATFYKR
ncbi:response regulator transcription factor [Zhaonella formicivorans]|uniref:response regulator transcription factor n=1 Tax=Zhaonella formicivorans TaxID=2528593 RepID=UPI0010ECB3B2|nr:response regulator transcription factor [Zhaonella formicivorans]